MTKIEWIQSQINEGITDLSVLNTPHKVDSNHISDFYQTLIDDINKNALVDSLVDITKLFQAKLLSEDSISKLQKTLSDIVTIEIGSEPQEVYLSPAQQAGYGIIDYQDWLVAKNP